MEQDLATALPLDGNHLVSGPPGTGKSVVALYRAQTLWFDDRTPTVLMFNRLLKQYTDGAAGELGAEVTISTFHAWFHAFWQRHYRTSPPRPAGSSDSWEYDWQAIWSKVVSSPPPQGELPDLIVDEGQDLPPDFFKLAKWIARNITVFADENQKLTENQSTLEEIARAIVAESRTNLTRNYRNTAEIARVAAHFYCGGPTGMPAPPTRSGIVPTATAFGRLNDLVEHLAGYARVHADKSIGVFCASKADQIRLVNRLNARDLPVTVEAYVSGDLRYAGIDFDKPGIKIINLRSVKGLEFDTVFIPLLETLSGDPTSASLRMLMYVATSRARDELHLSWCGGGEAPAIIAGIPLAALDRR
ncbi:3'-5' exonuclease [Demequina rhizosphaerae]|uniref:3'-5' exonuclease n=1 Tax=Demequina rhizosphaerae TaxID=1638985 RepID=UPI000782C58B|nr:3'-5' exonuclease [Demequina rhizosphaerae]